MGQREVALVLSEIAEELPSAVTLRLHLHEDVETSGERVRHWLRVLTDSGIQSDKYEIFNYWAHLIENRSVLVTQVPGIELEEMRGFSIGEHPFPVIAINGKDAPRGKTFTLLHELVHILLRHGGLCDLRDEYSSPDTAANRVEWFCNGVAAAVLMPRQVLLGEQLVAQAPSSKRWNDDELLFLSKRFGVSAEAMLLRLVTLNRASPEFYRERRPDFLRLYAEAGRLQSGGPGYYKDQVRFLGRAYIQMVLDAYDRADITDPDLARYLGNMKLKNVPKLVETLGSEP